MPFFYHTTPIICVLRIHVKIFSACHIILKIIVNGVCHVYFEPLCTDSHISFQSISDNFEEIDNLNFLSQKHSILPLEDPIVSYCFWLVTHLPNFLSLTQAVNWKPVESPAVFCVTRLDQIDMWLYRKGVGIMTTKKWLLRRYVMCSPSTVLWSAR